LQRLEQSKVEEAILVHKTLIKIIFSLNLMGPNLTGAEGRVFGIGCKIFTIAGPVILYGIFASWIAGVVYYFLDMAGVYWG
jgi:hypothetical protein